MKLYTEEQVKEMIEKSRETGLTAEYLILTTTPIELPSDEEIEEQFAFFPQVITGAKWMREQIQKQIQKQAIIDIMQADEKDGLYDDDKSK